jgi:hypothetical protein
MPSLDDPSLSQAPYHTSPFVSKIWHVDDRDKKIFNLICETEPQTSQVAKGLEQE